MEVYVYMQDWLEKEVKIQVVKGRPYARVGKEFLHRKIMNAKRGQIVDHINDNPLDNRPENLRFVTVGQNRQRSRCKSQGKSGYVGVCVSKKRWDAKIWFNNKCHYLGMFDTPEEAAHAYDKKALEFFGEHCKLNFEENRQQ
jgi:hypothetical protein